MWPAPSMTLRRACWTLLSTTSQIARSTTDVADPSMTCTGTATDASEPAVMGALKSTSQRSSSRALVLEERVTPGRRPRSEGPPTVVEVNEFFERCVPVTRLDVPTPPITQAPERGERRPIVGLEQRVCLGLDHGQGGQRRRRGGGHVQCCCPTPRKPDQVNGLPNVTYDGIDLVGIVVECAMSWKARATAAPEGIHGDQAVTRRP